MIQKIKNILMIAFMSTSLAVPAIAAPAVVYASNIDSGLCSGSTAASGEDCQNEGGSAGVETGLKKIAGDITKWFTIIVGGLSILMIIYGGFRYITSGGDSGRVGSAKNTIIYAIIGLLIVVLAQVIVNVVLKVGDETGSSF